jgi:sulfur carrier protein ThiS
LRREVKMKVTLITFGGGRELVEVPDGATVGDVLEAAGASSEGYKIQRNGVTTSPSATVEDGDILTVTPKVEGGR